jgi:hypothetical protein
MIKEEWLMRGVRQDDEWQMLYVYGSKFAPENRRTIIVNQKKTAADQQAETDFSQLLDREIHDLSAAF